MLMQILVHGCVWFDDETKKHLFSLCTLENGRVVKKKRTWKSWEHQSGKWRQVDMWWRERGWKQARTAGPLCPPHIHLTPFLWSMISRFPWILLHFCILGRPVNSSRLWATFSDSSWSHDRSPHLNCQAIKIPSQYQMLSKWSCLQVLWLHTHMLYDHVV